MPAAHCAVPPMPMEIAAAVERFVLGAEENRLGDFGGAPIFQKPLAAVADGDDPLFGEFRTAVHPDHMMPRAVLQRHAPGRVLDEVRVVCWVLPYSEEVRRSNRTGEWPSRLYSTARNNGGALNHALSRRMSRWFEERGWAAVAPSLTEPYEAFRCEPFTFSSTWSERHAAYAAGLGRFGLNAALITPAGIHVRLGSLVTDAPMAPSPREPGSHKAPCLEDGGAHCGACIRRCPVGAISPGGLDKEKCGRRRKEVRARFLEAYSRELHLLSAPIPKPGGARPGYSLGCALCQCGVPCEGHPPAADRRPVLETTP